MKLFRFIFIIFILSCSNASENTTKEKETETGAPSVTLSGAIDGNTIRIKWTKPLEENFTHYTLTRKYSYYYSLTEKVNKYEPDFFKADAISVLEAQDVTPPYSTEVTYTLRAHYKNKRLPVESKPITLRTQPESQQFLLYTTPLTYQTTDNGYTYFNDGKYISVYNANIKRLIKIYRHESLSKNQWRTGVVPTNTHFLVFNQKNMAYKYSAIDAQLVDSVSYAGSYVVQNKKMQNYLISMGYKNQKATLFLSDYETGKTLFSLPTENTLGSLFSYSPLKILPISTSEFILSDPTKKTFTRFKIESDALIKGKHISLNEKMYNVQADIKNNQLIYSTETEIRVYDLNLNHKYTHIVNGHKWSDPITVDPETNSVLIRKENTLEEYTTHDFTLIKRHEFSGRPIYWTTFKKIRTVILSVKNRTFIEEF